LRALRPAVRHVPDLGDADAGRQRQQPRRRPRRAARVGDLDGRELRRRRPAPDAGRDLPRPAAARAVRALPVDLAPDAVHRPVPAARRAAGGEGRLADARLSRRRGSGPGRREGGPGPSCVTTAPRGHEKERGARRLPAPLFRGRCGPACAGYCAGIWSAVRIWFVTISPPWYCQTSTGVTTSPSSSKSTSPAAPVELIRLPLWSR